MPNRYAAYSKLTIDYLSKRILRLTFNRPETYNSVDAETHTQLTNIWRDVNNDPQINAVIVTGAGKAFSAGGDFDLIKSILDDPVARIRRAGDSDERDLHRRARRRTKEDEISRDRPWRAGGRTDAHAEARDRSAEHHEPGEGGCSLI